jgi:hypothetical protein
MALSRTVSGLWLAGLVFFTTTAAVPPPETGATRERREPSLFGALDRDPKLKRRITVERTPENLGLLLRVIADKTGTQIVAQGDFLKKPVLVALKDVEAREVLTQVALAARGVWIKRNGIYRLLEHGIDTTSFQIGGSPTRANDAVRRLYASFTPHQRAYMQQRPLAFHQLTKDQQSLFTLAYNVAYVSQPELFKKETFVSLERTAVRLVPGDNGATTKLWLMAPMVTDGGEDTYGPFHMIDVAR